MRCLFAPDFYRQFSRPVILIIIGVHQRRRHVPTGDTTAPQALSGARQDRKRPGAGIGRQPRDDHRWIRAGDVDRDLDEMTVAYGPRRPVPTKLDPFEPILETRLTAFPDLAAMKRTRG